MELLEYLDSWLSEKIKIKESEKKIDSYTVINITETAIEAELKELPILYKDTEYKVLAFTLDENNLNESMKLLPLSAYSGLRGVVGNRGEILKISVHFALRGVVGSERKIFKISRNSG